MFVLPFIPFFVGSSYAFNIPFRAVSRAAGTPHSTSVIINSNNSLGFTNAGDSAYTATIFVQGEQFQVQIDSGSADLWINTQGITIEGLIDTGVNATIQYVDTTLASGPINLANVSFGEFTVEGQAFINAPGSNASDAGVFVGLLGVAPPSGSAVFQQLLNSTFNGLPLLTNIFHFHPEEANFLTFLLTRSNTGITQGGVMSIGELVSDLANITSTPQLPIVSSGSWETFMDGVYVDGQFFTGNSLAAVDLTVNPGPHQTTIVLDTGTSLAGAPRFYVDAMYKKLPHAKFSADMGSYILPCDTKVNISLVFGKNVFPIHPIDATVVNVNDDGTVSCSGAFSSIAPDAGVDFLLGDTFMRNVYTLLNFGGNFTDNADAGPPFMQILSTTDADDAFADFDDLNSQRISQLRAQASDDSTSSVGEVGATSLSFSFVTPTASLRFTSVNSGATASSSTNSKAHGGEHEVAAATASSSNIDLSALTRNTYIIMGLIVGALVLLIAVLFKLFSVSRANQGYRSVPNVTRAPVSFRDKQYEAEAFTTPYDDGGR